MADFISADTGTVAAAGRRTNATAEVWQGWSSRCSTVFGLITGEYHSARIASAARDYAEPVTTAARRVAQDVETLGLNATAAANTLDAADTEATRGLQQQYQVGDATGAALTRPINGEPVPV